MSRLLSVEITVLTVVAAGALVMAAGSTDPAQAADDRPCLTSGEHRQIAKGMTKKRVDGIADFPGVRSEWWADSWLYVWCKGDIYTLVTYTPPKPRRVVAKVKLAPNKGRT